MQGKGKSGNNRIFTAKILIITLFFKTCFMLGDPFFQAVDLTVQRSDLGVDRAVSFGALIQRTGGFRKAVEIIKDLIGYSVFG